MASFKAKFPVLQELFAKNHRGGALWAPPPAGRGLKNNVPTLQNVYFADTARNIIFSSFSLLGGQLVGRLASSPPPQKKLAANSASAVCCLSSPSDGHIY